MIRTHYKPRTHHRDAYGFGDTIGMMVRCNGRDLLDRHTAGQPHVDPRDIARQHVHATPLARKLTDAEIAEQAHYARLAMKYETAKAAA